MSAGIRVLARVIGLFGLGTLAVLHAVWASGSPWPARNPRRLAEAVVGQRMALPPAAPTAVVAAVLGVSLWVGAGRR